MKIYAMAFSRRTVRQMLSHYSMNIRDHVLKCIIYPDSQDVDHWITELIAWFSKSQQITCKSKLKASDYLETTFDAFGSTISDCESILEDFHFLYCIREHYTEFEISDNLVADTYKKVKHLERSAINLLLRTDVVRSSEWRHMLNGVLKRSR